MRRLLILACALSLVAAWLLLAPVQKSSAAPLRKLAPVQQPVQRVSAQRVPAQQAAAAPPAEKRLEGEALARRLDEQIPTRLYAEAARCYHGGRSPDEKIDLHYRLRVANGTVSVSEVHVEASTLGDSGLERCIIDRVETFRDRDDELPDLDEGGDVFVSIGGMKPFLPRAD
jgi:hypothetical protein